MGHKMDIDGFIEENKIDKVYSYLEVSGSDTSIKYGWAENNNLIEGEDVILSYHSRTKKASDAEKEWSKKEGTNAVSVSDYNKFFTTSTGFLPSEFVSMYSSNKEELVGIWDSKYPNQEEVLGFLYDLATLLEGGKKFVRYGRGFKIIKI